MSETLEAIKAYNNSNFNLTNFTEPGYPDRFQLDDRIIDWAIPIKHYSRLRPDFTHPDTIVASDKGLAEPYDFSRVERTFDGLTDTEGRPLFPAGRTGIAGLGKLWHWGESQTVDGVVTRDTAEGPQILVIGKKASGDKPKLPGGFINLDKGELTEDSQHAVAREIYEETKLSVPEEDLAAIATILTKSKRTTDNAWITTTGLGIHLDSRLAQQIPEGGDDADVARWVPLTQDLIDRMSEHHGALVKASLELSGIAISNSF